MGRMQRTKGANYEREVARTLQAMWPEAKRGIGQARSAGEVADVEGTPFWVECKRQRQCRIPAAYAQARAVTDGRPVLVVSRDDHDTALVTMSLDDWMQWISSTKKSDTSLET